MRAVLLLGVVGVTTVTSLPQPVDFESWAWAGLPPHQLEGFKARICSEEQEPAVPTPSAREPSEAKWLILDHRGDILMEMLSYLSEVLSVPSRQLFYACAWAGCDGVPVEMAAHGSGVVNVRRRFGTADTQSRWLTYALDEATMKPVAAVYEAVGRAMGSVGGDGAWRAALLLQMYQQCRAQDAPPIADVIVCQFPGVQCLVAARLARHVLVRQTHRWDYKVCGGGGIGIPREIERPLSLAWGRELQRLEATPGHLVAVASKYDVAYFEHFFASSPLWWPGRLRPVNAIHAPTPARARDILLIANRQTRTRIGEAVSWALRSVDIINSKKETGFDKLARPLLAAGYNLQAPADYNRQPVEIGDDYLNKLAEHPFAVVVPVATTTFLVRELHEMGMPMLAPTPRLLASLHLRGNIGLDRCCEGELKCKSKVQPADFGVLASRDAIDEDHVALWLQHCDVYSFPDVKQFDSMAELVSLVREMSGVIGTPPRDRNQDPDIERAKLAVVDMLSPKPVESPRARAHLRVAPPGFYAAASGSSPSAEPQHSGVSKLRWLVVDGHAAPHNDFLQLLSALGTPPSQVAAVCFHMYCAHRAKYLTNDDLSKRWAKATAVMLNTSGTGVQNNETSLCRSRECASAGSFLAESGREAFHARLRQPEFGGLLDSIDAVACNFPSTQCLAFAGLNKTLVMRFSHRFDHWTRPVEWESLVPGVADQQYGSKYPIVRVQEFVTALQAIARSSRHIVATTNAYDWAYLLHYTGISAVPLPTLGVSPDLWASYSPKGFDFFPVLPNKGPQTSALLWLLLAVQREEERSRAADPSLRQVDIDYPSNRDWKALAAQPAAILFPYSVHAGVVIELYSLGVPLLVPDAKLFARLTQRCGAVGHKTAQNTPSLLRDYFVTSRAPAVLAAEEASPWHGISPIASKSEADVEEWLRLGDPWQLPHVITWSSAEELVRLVRSLQADPSRLRETSRRMKEHWLRVRDRTHATARAALGAAMAAKEAGEPDVALKGSSVIELSQCKLNWDAGCMTGRFLRRERPDGAVCGSAQVEDCGCDPDVPLSFNDGFFKPRRARLDSETYVSIQSYIAAAAVLALCKWIHSKCRRHSVVRGILRVVDAARASLQQ
eukprot:TRINITY_DN3449_c0_g1_i2.p1 TRINITY_DN3449_c0_g1~~TRINITY_DN3449_c0_g1_i2.p1  ORF type:complete len:1122 (+),score=237.93 TRINITY_DN3449_c0_g1_i2:79-3444(+)